VRAAHESVANDADVQFFFQGHGAVSGEVLVPAVRVAHLDHGR
jgi:altronate dehydratase